MRIMAAIGSVVFVGAAAYYVGRAGRDSVTPPPANNSISLVSVITSPDVVFVPDRIDLGAVTWGTQATAEASVFNSGTRVVEIVTVRATCACMVAAVDIEGRRLAPGESTLVPFTFAADFIAGHKHAEIRIETTDGLSAALPVFVHVIGSWTLSAETISFGDVELGAKAPVVRTVNWTSAIDEFEALDIEGAPWLTHDSIRRQDGAVELHLKVSPARLAPGLNTVNALLRTSSPHMPRGVLLIRARGVRPVQPSVDHVTLAGSETKLISFWDSSGQPAKLADVVTDHPAIVGKLASSSTVEVSNPAGAPLLRLVELRIHDEGGNSCSVSVASF